MTLREGSGQVKVISLHSERYRLDALFDVLRPGSLGNRDRLIIRGSPILCNPGSSHAASFEIMMLFLIRGFLPLQEGNTK